MPAALLLLLASVDAPLHLSCVGRKVGNWANPTLNGRGAVSDEQVEILLFSGNDRIRMPKALLPPIHGGTKGWFRLDKVKVEGGLVRASVKLNFASRQSILIDRDKGTIAIGKDGRDLSGKCQIVDRAKR